jgi:hypothetical protein
MAAAGSWRAAGREIGVGAQVVRTRTNDMGE